MANVQLRPFGARDAEMIMDLSTDPYLPKIGSIPANATRAQALVFLDEQRAQLENGLGYPFCIADRETGEALGTIALWTRFLVEGRASVGYTVAPRNRGRGLAGEALALLTGFAWGIPELFRVEAYIEPRNVGSLRAAEFAGYEREGLLRSRIVVGGERADVLLYAAIRPA